MNTRLAALSGWSLFLFLLWMKSYDDQLRSQLDADDTYVAHEFTQYTNMCYLQSQQCPSTHLKSSEHMNHLYIKSSNSSTIITNHQHIHILHNAQSHPSQWPSFLGCKQVMHSHDIQKIQLKSAVQLLTSNSTTIITYHQYICALHSAQSHLTQQQNFLGCEQVMHSHNTQNIQYKYCSPVAVKQATLRFQQTSASNTYVHS